MIVIGAGLSGLIAANILRDEVEGIWEASKEVPNNHNAILRFRSNIVSVTTNIPFKKVKVMKAVEAYENPFAEMISYSMKVTGQAQSRSIVTANGELVERYIAPSDFVNQLYNRVSDKVELGRAWGREYDKYGPFISTMPMPKLMNLLGYPHDKDMFQYRQGFVVRAKLKYFNAYGTVYIPDASTPLYRVSVTGDELYCECVGEAPPDQVVVDSILWHAIQSMGLMDVYSELSDGMYDIEVKIMQYAKINPIDDKTRKDFILWASEHGVFSLGRFATWRPSLLLDDLINDVNVIRRLAGGDKTPNYELKLGEAK